MKKFLSVCMIFAFFLIPLGAQVALAEDVKEEGQKEVQQEEKKGEEGAGTDRISNKLFQGYTDGIYKDKYYEIDTYQPKEDEKGFIKKGWDYLFGDDSVGKDIQRMLYTTCQWFANMAFQLNVILAQLTIFLVDQALKLDIVDAIADKLAAAMQNIAGVGGDGFLDGGLFPAIIGITCALSACYAGYVFFVKRQPTAGINELIKTVLVIAFIVVYVGNAGTILKSANTISSEISTVILAKSTGTVAGDPGRSKEDAIFAVKKQIWDLLIERPYMFLQYGEDSKEKLGAQRVDDLLAKSPGKDREETVKKEVKAGNQMMLLPSVSERLVFTLMYYVVNTFAGIPVILFCLLIVALQLWFMVMSIIAPIVMATALLPGNRRVIESWAKQWIKPLALKILASALLVIIFTVAELLYVLPEAGIAGYVSTMILQILVFVLCYIFRDNLVASFRKVRGVYEVATDISLMTERFVDRGKEFAGDTMHDFGETVGDHFHTAAELVAVGENVDVVENELEKDQPQLIKADVPKDLPVEEMEQEKADKKKQNLISLQDRAKKEAVENQEGNEEREEQMEQEEEEDSSKHQLISLDKEAFENQLEEEQELASSKEAEMDEELPTQEDNIESLPHEKLQEIDIVDHSTNELDTREGETEESLQEIQMEEKATDIVPQELITDDPPTNIPAEEFETAHVPTDIRTQDTTTREIPTTVLSQDMPTQEMKTEEIPTGEIPGAIRADVTEDGVIVPRTENANVSLVRDSIPGTPSAKVDETERILPQPTHIDVESTNQAEVSESSFSTPSQSISNLAPVKHKENNEIVSEWDAEQSDIPNLHEESLAAGSENWTPPSQEMQNLERLSEDE